MSAPLLSCNLAQTLALSLGACSRALLCQLVVRDVVVFLGILYLAGLLAVQVCFIVLGAAAEEVTSGRRRMDANLFRMILWSGLVRGLIVGHVGTAGRLVDSGVIPGRGNRVARLVTMLPFAMILRTLLLPACFLCYSHLFTP